MPLQATSGAASYDGFGGGVAAIPNYIEDVFSTYLVTGSTSPKNISNGVDLAGKGGMVWTKWRSGASSHYLYDTARGATNYLSSNTTTAQTTLANSLTAFNADGFTLGSEYDSTTVASYATWTFRKQPKFFDVVTYTGDDTERTISHNLGSVPGCIIVKRTDTTSNWTVYHRELNATNAYQYYISLNLTTAKTADNIWGAAPTSTVFTVTADAKLNASGGTYVAYLFAHDAGGFGLTGTDNVISCGSFTTNGSGVPPNVNLGYEPQWILHKSATSVYPWRIQDNMRGATADGAVNYLAANSSAAESPDTGQLGINATGFGGGSGFGASTTYIYIAIRRGPMKVPTSGTSVFAPVTRTGTGTDTTISGVGFAPDAVISKTRGVGPPTWWDKLRGAYPWLKSSATDAEGTTTTNALLSYTNDGVNVGTDGNQGNINYSGFDYITYFLRRAPGFFDEVCYTGTGSARTLSHNLGVAPELIIVKSRSSGTLDWLVYSAPTGNANALLLNTTDSSFGSTSWGSTTPTASVFSTGATGGTNNSGATFVAYLFATCAGVSKVGSYTGNGTTKQIDCGFTGGARFVLLKATSTTGNWMVYDTARGMTTLTDPFLSLNSTSAETATLGACTTVSTGFAVNESILAGVNTNGVSFVYLAIA